jgi:hypothetical protein
MPPKTTKKATANASHDSVPPPRVGLEDVYRMPCAVCGCTTYLRPLTRQVCIYCTHVHEPKGVPYEHHGNQSDVDPTPLHGGLLAAD